MKGIILAGGYGNRLKPLTLVTNKHLLPVYNKPMILYPLQTLLDGGIEDIMIVTGPQHAGGFISLLGSGRKFGCKISFEVQEEPGGIAHALGLTRDFIGQDKCAVILGDNIFSDNFGEEIKKFVTEKKSGGKIFLKKVTEAERFGVAELKNIPSEPVERIMPVEIMNIEEKPKQPKSPYAVTGFYLYDNQVFSIIDSLKPSARNELEITDVSMAYLQRNQLQAVAIPGEWTDAGTFESLYRANQVAREITLQKGPLAPPFFHTSSNH